MPGLWEGITDLASSSWDQVQGGLQQWVGVEVNEELDQLNDSSGNPSSQPGNGSVTTGSPPADDNLAYPGGSPGFYSNQASGGGISLQTAATVAGLLASAIVVYSFATR